MFRGDDDALDAGYETDWVILLVAADDALRHLAVDTVGDGFEGGNIAVHGLIDHGPSDGAICAVFDRCRLAQFIRCQFLAKRIAEGFFP